MQPALFLQSELPDPYALYKIMLSKNPVYWDEKNKLWAIYLYKDCVAVLKNIDAHIPSVHKSGLNGHASQIADHLARLSNGSQHPIARDAAMLLAGKIKLVSIENLMKDLVAAGEIDWVEKVCKKLPVLAILKGLDFSDNDIGSITAKTVQLNKIMLPHKTAEQIESINEISTKVYAIVKQHLIKSGLCNDALTMLTGTHSISKKNALTYIVSNLIGLVIQSHDAGRGVLSNSLLQLLNSKHFNRQDVISKTFIEKIVIETLRFDAPVQNTRRIATSTIFINNIEIKEGETMLIVLASANRDPAQFINADEFNPKRKNNSEHLTFGIGNHMCIAKHFSVAMATAALTWLFITFKNTTLLEQEITYEPLVNVRLPKKIILVAEG